MLAGSYCSTIVKEGSMQDGGGQGYGECFEIPMGREIWFQNRVVSQFSESQKFVLCNSSEGGGREGARERGNKGEGEEVCSKMERGLGVSFLNLSSYNQVSAAGQVTTEILMLISNLWRTVSMCYCQLSAVRYENCT